MDYRNGGRHTPEALFAAQHGVVARSQLLALGLTARMIDRRVASGTWVAVHRGVYRMTGVRVSWHQRLMAACLAASGMASHRSAAALWQLDGMTQGRLEITAARGATRQMTAVTVHHSRTITRTDAGSVDGIPCTSVARTIADLAGVLDDATLEQVLDSALREGQISVAYLVRQLERLGRGRTGVEGLRALLEDRRLTGERPAESRREADLARLLVKAGLPRPVRQHELRRDDGTLVARFDLAYPEARIAVEFQSYRHHYGRHPWRRDMVRGNGAAAEDWLVFGCTEQDVRERGGQAAGHVARAYRARMPPKLNAA